MNTFLKSIFLTLAALAVGITSSAQQPRLPSEQAGERDFFLEKLIRLSSDEFAGRKPGSPQEGMVIDYIAKGFEEVGMKPAGEDGGWFQSVKLLSTTSRTRGGILNIKAPKGKIALKEAEDYVMWTNRCVSNIDLKNVEYVFCGFGINAPEFGWDDFKGLDVKGKVIVCMVGDPGFYNEDLFHGKRITYYARYTYKFEEARRQGAAGVMVVHNNDAASYGWQVVRNGAAGAKQELYDGDHNMDDVSFKGWFTEPAASELLTRCGYDPDEVFAAAKVPGFKGFPLKAKGEIHLDVKAEVSVSHNVAGILPGTDLKDEYVLYSAHWDHLGIGPEIDGDNIYNGAADNATGVAGIMMIARRFAGSDAEHRRSIVFLATTAEEAGLLGGQYYCEHPLVPVEKTAVAINIDGLGPLSATSDLSLNGSGLSEVDRYVDMAAAAQGRTVKKRYTDPAGISYRTDLFNFLNVGIPGVLAGNGSEYIDKEAHDALPWTNTYHMPSDEYQPWWPLDGVFEMASFYHGMGLMISNADSMPKWYGDSGFHR